jgi:hypothetical protein
MNSSSFSLRTMVTITMLWCACGSVLAQKQQREPGRWMGKLKGIGPGGVLQVESDKGEQWLVALDRRPQEVSFQGSATPAFLRPGMLVQFTAMIDKKGEAQEPLGEIKVISQRMGIQLGLQAGGNLGAGLFNSDDDSDKKKKKVRSDTSSYLVTGTLRSINNGKMYIAAGATIKAEVADNCRVNFDIADFSLARAGDSVEIHGWRYPNQANQLYASRLTIIADKVLDPEEKKRRPGTKNEEKKPDEEKAGDKKPDDKKPDDKKPDDKKAGVEKEGEKG